MKLSQVKHLFDIGFSLIYLYERDKRPLQNGWTERPNKTWKELEREFNPKLNIGVRLGEHSKIGSQGYLACIDVDIKDERYAKAALKKLKEITNGKEESFPTVLSGSGNGSRHLYATSRRPFKMVQLEKQKGKWEICVYSTGRQMVLAPSTHPSGASYRWQVPLLDASDLPNLPDLSRFTAPRSEGEEKRGHSVDREGREPFQAREVCLDRLDPQYLRMLVDGVGADDRSAALLAVAMHMCRRKYSDDEILSVLSNSGNYLGTVAYEHANTRDRGRAVKWLRRYTLGKAREETSLLREFVSTPSCTGFRGDPEQETERVKTEIADEKSQVLPDTTKDGRPKSTLRNVKHVLDVFLRKKLGGPLSGFDEFACRSYFLRKAPWGSPKGQELKDTDDVAMQFYIASHYGFEPAKVFCRDALELISWENTYHPIRDYLSSLKWNGTPRLDDWLIKVFGATGPKEYLNAIGRKVLVAAVARVFEPGCKFDTMMVLEGPQGRGKSKCLQLLAGGPKFFIDNLGNIGDKDVVDQMAGKWIIEMAELSGMSKADNNVRKGFLSRQNDRVRKSYGRRSEDYPRQCIFIGSTNEQEYLNDPTGNRRYWPVQTGTIDHEWIARHREQLWAEARVRYEEGELLYLPENLEPLARKEQEKRFEVDELEYEVKRIIAKNPDQSYIRVPELWRAIREIPDTGVQPDMRDAKRIGSILLRIGYRKRVQRIGGISSKVWMKKESV